MKNDFWFSFGKALPLEIGGGVISAGMAIYEKAPVWEAFVAGATLVTVPVVATSVIISFLGGQDGDPGMPNYFSRAMGLLAAAALPWAASFVEYPGRTIENILTRDGVVSFPTSSVSVVQPRPS